MITPELSSALTSLVDVIIFILVVGFIALVLG